MRPSEVVADKTQCIIWAALAGHDAGAEPGGDGHQADGLGAGVQGRHLADLLGRAQPICQDVFDGTRNPGSIARKR
jgi:hypothetical protein